MLLAIDIGNTHTVVGLYLKRQLLNHWRITSNLARTEDEVGVVIQNFFRNSGRDIADMDGAAISSVVPDLTPIYTMMCQKYLSCDPLIITSDIKLGLDIKYRDPTSVGADRICNAVAGIEKFGKPLIIIDFGTATTFDCVDSRGNYIGGAIAPGINASINMLHKHAAKLPRVDAVFPEHVIGQTTDESIQSGIFFGTLFMVEGMVKRLKQELGPQTRVIATGGLADKIATQTNCVQSVESHLNLEGIVSVYYKNKTAGNSFSSNANKS